MTATSDHCPAGILYLHGFCSAPSSWKARLLAERMAERGLADRYYCPALSIEPEEAIAQCESLIAAHSQTFPGAPLTLVGSSLGGYLATHLAEKHGLNAVLLNPAVVAPLSLARYLGPQTNFYTGETFILTERHLDGIRALDVERVTPGRYLLLVETGDEVLDYRLAVDRYTGSRQIVVEGGEHSLRSFPDHLPQLFEFCGL